MATSVNCSDTIDNWSGSFNEFTQPIHIFPIEPLFICFGCVNGALKDPRPLQMRCVEVRVRDHDALESALGVYKLYGCGINK